MKLPWQVSLVHWNIPTALPILPYLHTEDTGRVHYQNSTVFPHNVAMPDISSVNVAIDVARRLADALANLTLAAPFTRFVAQTMYAIQQLADIFSATGAPTPIPTPPPRHTLATIQLPMM